MYNDFRHSNFDQKTVYEFYKCTFAISTLQNNIQPSTTPIILFSEKIDLHALLLKMKPAWYLNFGLSGLFLVMEFRRRETTSVPEVKFVLHFMIVDFYFHIFYRIEQSFLVVKLEQFKFRGFSKYWDFLYRVELHCTKPH